MIKLILIFSFFCSALSAASRPNIIFIFADDWGFGDLAIHGHPELKTPHLDKMAAEGTDFYHFKVNSGVCSPSRTALMTGNFPAVHRIHRHFPEKAKLAEAWGMPLWLDNKVTLLPRLLQQSGYKTAHYGKWHLTNRPFKNAPLPISYGYDDAKCFNDQLDDWEDIEANESHLLADMLVNKSIDFIKKTEGKPFFINLWLHESHTPIHATDEMRKVYPGVQEPQLTYYAALTNADKQLGRLFAFLKKQGLEENTLVVFSSDNGPASASDVKKRATYYSRGVTAGRKGRKASIMEGGVNVPFIVKWPGKVPAGKVDKQKVFSAVDMLPTFCSLAGVELPANYKSDGEDVSPILRGESFVKKKAIFWDWRKGSKKGDFWPEQAIADGPWKLYARDSFKRVELYNIIEDPFEQNNLYKKKLDLSKSLVDKLKTWCATLPK